MARISQRFGCFCIALRYFWKYHHTWWWELTFGNAFNARLNSYHFHATAEIGSAEWSLREIRIEYGKFPCENWFDAYIAYTCHLTYASGKFQNNYPTMLHNYDVCSIKWLPRKNKRKTTTTKNVNTLFTTEFSENTFASMTLFTQKKCVMLFFWIKRMRTTLQRIASHRTIEYE